MRSTSASRRAVTEKGVTIAPSNTIGNPSAGACELLSGVAEYLHKARTLRSNGRGFAWKDKLVKSLAFHRAGQEMGIGTQRLAFKDHHRKNLAHSVRGNPERMVAATLAATERSAYMLKDGHTRERLRSIEQKREQRRRQHFRSQDRR